MQEQILYEDGQILLCRKAPGLDAQEALPGLLRRQCGAESLFCVHRLDKPAAGLMVYAKTREAAASLSEQLRAGRFAKGYLAVVEGVPEEAGELRDLLYHDAARNKSYVVKRMRRGVREAALRYRRLEQREGLSLLRIELLTGRSHQIRVQFASRGMPLLGDRPYGSRQPGGLALWSEELRFFHPQTGEEISQRLSPPARFPWTAFSILQGDQACDTSKSF